MIRAIMKPYNPKASAKIRMSIIPENSLSCCALALIPKVKGLFTSITNNTNGKSGSKTGKSTAQSSSEVRVSLEVCVGVHIDVTQNND